MASDKDVFLYKSWQKSPVKFVEDMWSLKAQPLKKEFKDKALELIQSPDSKWSRDFSDQWFEPFVKGEHITWHQWMLLISVQRAISGIDKRRITVESGHGVGKTCALSWLIIWFLFCFKDAQIPCTAPTSSQMHDVLWKELAKWIQKLKPEIKCKFDWTSEYLRITESPETWFARAKTAKKEAPEALAGMHGDFVMFIIDEACHDKETQILTDNGWKYFYNLLSSDKVLTMNDKGIAEYQKPTHYHEYAHNGDMIKLDRRGVNMLVTPNHNLWAKTKKAGYRKLRADSLTGTDMYMDRTISWEGKPAKDIEMVKLNDNNAKVNRRVSKKEHYEGKVYCVTVPNGLVMTRRYGYAVWSGNSGVPEEVFNTAEGALTAENILVIMISNHTRLLGYFHTSHTSDSKNWQRLSFNSEQSPVVDRSFVQRILEKHGKDSDEYKIRVAGTSPSAEGMDDRGFVPLLIEQDIRFVSESPFIGEIRMGVDPSGEGQDESAWLARDNFKLKVLGKEKISNSKSIAMKTMTWMTEIGVKDKDVMLDNFGEGADVSKEMALSNSRYNIGTVNVGQSSEEEIYLNLRAEAFFRFRTWFKLGGYIIDSPLGRELAKELLAIKYRRNESGKIQIMSKQEMRKQGIASPNFADAGMLTFVKHPTVKTENIQFGGVTPFYDSMGF